MNAGLFQWSHGDAVGLCVAIEAICPAYGCHVALTGGTLYKDGPRKDCDILFYRIRQVQEIDIKGLIKALAGIGLFVTSGFGWCYKFEYSLKSVDAFFPEEQGGPDYGSEGDNAAAPEGKEAVTV